MAKTVIQIGLEGRALRGIRLENDGENAVCGAAGFWPFDAAPVPVEGADAEGAPPPGEEDFAPGAGDGPEEESDPLADALAEAAAAYKTREVSLSLPLSALLVKVVKVPADRREEIEDALAAEMKALSPFPDEDLKVGWEIVRETESDVYAVAAALTEAKAAEIGESLAAAGLTVVRTDASALGWLRTLWPRLTETSGIGRRLVLLDLDGNGWELAVLDDDTPVVLRGLGAEAGADLPRLRREITLSLVEAERACGARDVGEVVAVSRAETPAETLALFADFGPVRAFACGDETGGVEGCARRADEGNAFDVTPYAWEEALREGRFRRRLNFSAATAFGVWILLVAAAVGGLFAVDALTGRVAAKSKQHHAAYTHVKDMKNRVKLVQRYSNHNRGVLEMLKAVSDRLPEGVTLTSFQYKRDDGVKVAGEAEQPSMVYDFKNALVKCESVTEDDDEDARTFTAVQLRGPSASRGVHKFDIDASLKPKEEE